MACGQCGGSFYNRSILIRQEEDACIRDASEHYVHYESPQAEMVEAMAAKKAAMEAENVAAGEYDV